MAIVIDLSKCDVCSNCVNACPTNAITYRGNKVVVDDSLCTLCKRCIDVCPSGAISEELINEGKTNALSPVPQTIEVIKAEPIPVRENPKHPILGEIAGNVVLRLLDSLISLLNRSIRIHGNRRTNIRKNQSSANCRLNRHRRQKRGRSRKR